MTIVLRKELEKLKTQASEIIEDAETREASKDYYAHNTVEQLF
jgi:COMPASS component SPP1